MFLSTISSAGGLANGGPRKPRSVFIINNKLFSRELE